jgi:CTP synthase
MPWIAAAGELKTKPTQHSVRELQALGIHPDVLLVRADREIPESERRKLSLFCNVRQGAVIQALDVADIHEVPLAYHREGLDAENLAAFGIDFAPQPSLERWQDFVERLRNPEGQITVAIVGKYTTSKDAYKSLTEALRHGAAANRLAVAIKWVDAEDVEKDGATSHLADVDAVLVPGGFGRRGSEGKIAAVQHARENALPFLGICFGMQMAVVEAARNLAGLEDASSTEFGNCKDPVVGLITEWSHDGKTERRDADTDLGGTMRLGSYKAALSEGSLASKIYGAATATDRHRHRYEVNMAYRNQLEGVGLLFSGVSPDGRLPEIVERSDHPWFLAVQFHPELRSRPLEPHPIFCSFAAAAAVAAGRD